MLRIAVALLLARFALAPAAAAGPDVAPPPALRAGAAVVALPLPPGGPLGGYGGVSDRRAEGVLDPPEARALVLEDGALRLAIVSLDVVIVRPGLRDAVRARTRGADVDALLVVATHTHSGPGGYVEGWLGERMTAGTFEPGTPDRLAEAAAEAVTRAAATLAPARIGVGEGRLDLARNRRRPGGPRETSLPAIELVDAATGAPIARLFAYGVHAVALGPQSHDYSADLVGVARAILDEGGGVSLFLPGPLGDQNPLAETHAPWPEDVSAQRANARAHGERMAGAVHDASAKPASAATLAFSEITAPIPPIAPRVGSLLWWLWPLASAEIEGFLSPRGTFQAIRIGDACLLAFPAEPSSELGDAARRLAPSGCTPFVIAHANDWLGYALEPDDYDRGGYEAGLQVLGRDFGAWLLAGVRRAAQGLSFARESAGNVAP